VAASLGLFLSLIQVAWGVRANGSAGNSRPRILATGDSMMRNVDIKIGDELGRDQVDFRSDIRIGSGVSRDDWVARAREQVREHRPDATVVFVGGAEGYPMSGAFCCGRAWTSEYVNRVEKMMRIYSRKGTAEVYWVTLPAPRELRWRRIFAVVNRAVRRAVRRSGPHAHLVDAWAVFTPGGRYRSTARNANGEQVVVRNADGKHLSWQGSALVARLVRDALLGDGIVPELRAHTQNSE